MGISQLSAVVTCLYDYFFYAVYTANIFNTIDTDVCMADQMVMI